MQEDLGAFLVRSGTQEGTWGECAEPWQKPHRSYRTPRTSHPAYKAQPAECVDLGQDSPCF